MATNSELYHVVREPRSGGAGPHPTVVLLHGRGTNENDLLPLVDELAPTFFVVSVRAPLPFGPGYAWYPMGTDATTRRAALIDSLDALARLIDALPGRYPVDPTHLFPLGFSQGAVMAGSLLVKHPNVPAGTVMLSGFLPVDDLQPIDRIALLGREVFVAHGTQDPIVPLHLGEATRDFFLGVGADLIWREYPIAHTISAQEIVDVAGWFRLRLSGS